MHELCELILGRGSNRSRRTWTAQVLVERLEERIVPSAPVDGVNFAAAMLNKLTVGGGGGDPTVGPYSEEGFRTGGRTQLAAHWRDLINSFGESSDVYVPKLNEFAPQFYFSDTAPNRARDSWVRDFDRLKELVAGPASPKHVDALFADASYRGDAMPLSAGGKKEPEDTCHYRIGCGREGRSALIVAGDPNGTPADSPGNHIDPNTADSPFAGVGVVSLVRGKNVTGGGTGVAIGPRHVLTAAHVVDINRNGHHDGADYDSIEFWLNLDTDSPVDRPDVIIPATRWYIHPDSFHPGNLYDFFHDDVAVIELSAPLPEGVPFYQLYTGDLAGQTLHMVGHGRSGDGVNGYTVPASRTVKRVGQNVADYFEGQDDHDRPEAIELWQSDFDHPTDTSLNLFGGPSLGNDKETTAGPGDSGGPAFVRVGSNPDKASSYQIGGVITHSLEGLSTFGLFGSGFGGTVVSAYEDWIRAILAGNVSALENGGLSGTSPSAGGLTAYRGVVSDFSQSTGLFLDRFSLARSGDLVTIGRLSVQPVTMATGAANNSATTSDSDYMAKTGTVTFAPGETTKTCSQGRQQEGGQREFYLDLFGLSSNALFIKSRGSGTILNDD